MYPCACSTTSENGIEIRTLFLIENSEGPVIPAKAGIQPDYPFKRVPPTPLTFLDHLDFPRLPPSLDRLLPCGGLGARSSNGCLHDISGFLVSPGGSVDCHASKYELGIRRARLKPAFVLWIPAFAGKTGAWERVYYRVFALPNEHLSHRPRAICTSPCKLDM